MKFALRYAAVLALVLVANALGALTYAADPTQPSFAGTWQGTLDAGAVKLRIVFDIKVTATGLEGTMDSPDQRALGLKLDTVKQDGANVTAELRMIGGTYDGTFSADGSEIVGKWNQSGMSLPLTLKRGEKIVPAGSLDMRTPPRQSFPAVEAALKAAKNNTSTPPHG
jgi:uncharacterized protein